MQESPQKIAIISTILLICVNCYLIYLISSFHRDVQSVKHTLKHMKNILKDTWAITGGNLPDKVRVIKDHGGTAWNSISDNLGYLKEKISNINKQE